MVLTPEVRELLEGALDALEGTPCSLWACDGPDSPREARKTCGVCRSIQDLRAALESARTLVDRQQELREQGLVSTKDIASRLGVRSSAVSNWRARHADFPTPALVLAGGEIPIYRWSEVQAWHERRRKHCPWCGERKSNYPGLCSSCGRFPNITTKE